MLHANPRSLLLVSLIGVAACDRNAPTAAPPPPPSTAPVPIPEFMVVPASLGTALRGLDAAQRARFEAGRAVFATVFTPATGLGPLFNSVGCANCHEEPVVGGSGSNDPKEGGEDIEIHATAFHGAGAPCDDLAAVGGQVIQKQVTPALSDALGITAEPIPAAATDSGHRTTPDLFGFGLLDAVPDAEILARADPLDRNGDGISGRPNRTADGRLGRFGRKAQAATLREFNADAFVMEMGITNPLNQTEQTVGGLPFPAGIDPLPEPEISAAHAFRCSAEGPRMRRPTELEAPGAEDSRNPSNTTFDALTNTTGSVEPLQDHCAGSKRIVAPLLTADRMVMPLLVTTTHSA